MITASIIKVLIGIALVLVAYQDFRFRAVHWSLFPVLFGLFLALSLSETGWYTWLENFAVNVTFLLLQLSVITIWFSLRTGKWTLIFDRFIGWGDILLFLVFAAAFSPLAFMLFMVGGLFLVLLVYGARILISRKQGELIPLAGCLGIFYLLCDGLFMLFPDSGNNLLSLTHLL